MRTARDELKRDVASEAVRAAPDELKPDVAAAAVLAAPDTLKTEVAAAVVNAARTELKPDVAAGAVRAAPDELKPDVAAEAVRAAPAELEPEARAGAKRVAAEAVRAAPDELKPGVAAGAVRAARDELKRDVAAGAVEAAPDELKSEVAAQAVQAAVTSNDLRIDDVRAAVDELRSSLADVLRRPVVCNVEGNLRLFGHLKSPHELELEVTINTGQAAWRDAAPGQRPEPAARSASTFASPSERVWSATARQFRLIGGEDMPTAPFEIVVDAPGLHLRGEARTSVDLAASGGSCQWRFSIVDHREDKVPMWERVPIWVTLYSSGRYVQAAKLPPRAEVQGNEHE